jgi:Ca2+-binding EF-hand superfamily protein
MYYGKKAAEEEFAEEERTKRKAQDLWAEIASKVLNMDPQRSTEEEMKEAFSVFDDQRIGESDDDDSGSESDGQGEIEVGELKAFRDSDRKLVPRKPGEPPLELFGFEATDDEIDSMLYEADLDGEGKIDYDEFVSVIFSAWERKQQTDNLSKWLFRNYKRIDHGERSKAAGFTPQKKLFAKDIGMHQKFLSEHKSLAERGEELICNPTLFAGLVDSLGDLSAKMDEKNPRWKGLARSFHVDMKINRIIGACQRSIYIIHMYSLNFRSRLLAARAYLETNQACLLPHQASKRLEGILTTSKRAWTA